MLSNINIEGFKPLNIDIGKHLFSTLFDMPKTI